MHIVGTAGHVDHGKSALVAALTGTNPDRWIEEQLRGMTLDLGFAHLVLDDGLEAGIVDVPGHERFLHNMLAGAAGMDVLLLVIAANEGVMPQTREHLEILGFLNVRRSIVALTKIDLVTPDQLENARAEIERALHGTVAQDAPVVGVSSITGEGLDRLRKAIAEALRSLPPRDPDAPVYLPVDRVFALPGLGTIVTGTLIQGRIAVGDTLALQPSGKSARVRSLQVFGKSRERVDAGSRVALSLPAVDRHAIARGETAASTEFSARSSFTVRFTPLERALSLMRRRMPVRAHIGSAEILGTLVLARLPAQVEEVRAELHLREPTVVFPGIRFVVRRLSPKTLLGGGYVEGVTAHAAVAGLSSAEAAVLAALRERGFDPIDTAAVALAANLREMVAQRALDALVARGDAMRVARPAAYVDAAAARELLARALARLDEAHRSEPWAMGLTSIALARSLDVPEVLLVRLLAAFVEDGRLVNRAGYFAAVDFSPKLTPEQQAAVDRLVSVSDDAPLRPVPFEGAVAGVRRSQVSGVGKAFDTLLARGALVKVGDELYRGSQIARIRARVEEYLQRHERMTAAEFRDLLGTSRKYAVPVLEWLDASGITLRSGDYRTLRKSARTT